MRISVHWLVPRHKAGILACEAAASAEPWEWEEDYARRLRFRECIGLVAEDPATETVLGVLVFWWRSDTTAEVERLLVHPAHRRRGVATALLKRLRAKVIESKRIRITAWVPDGALAAHLLLKTFDYGVVRADAGSFRFVWHRELSLVVRPEAVMPTEMGGEA
jgi:GNAT superfamily N-acetyltransferase